MKANQTLRKTTMLALSGVAAVGLAAHMALAQTQPSAPVPQTEMHLHSQVVAKVDLRFEEVDANKDGYIDRTEAAGVSGLNEAFDRADKNADGKLDKIEYAAALRQLQSKQ